MEYKTSLTEISRRKKAYATLSTSIILGLFLASFVLKFPISIYGYLLVTLSLDLIGIFSFSFFHNLIKMRIILSKSTLYRNTSKYSEKYQLDHTSRIRIKWTTNNSIREIYLWFDDGKSVFVTGLDCFEEFRKELLKNVGENTNVVEVRERIDFDHPIFYSLLGLPISMFEVLLFKYFSTINYQQLQIGIIVLSIYLFFIGMYFIVTRPISKRSGNKTVISDYIIGLFMVCSGIIFYLIFR